MKRLAAAVLLALGTAAPAAAASPVSLGVELDLASRDIRYEDVNVIPNEGTADTTGITGQVAVGIVRGVSLFGEVGAADVAVDEFNGYQSSFNLVYGGGLRLSAPMNRYAGSALLFSELRARRITSSDQLMTLVCTQNCFDADPNNDVESSEAVDEDLDWWEYTIKVGVSGQYDNVRPFGGIEVSKLDGTDSVDFVDPTLSDQTLDVRESNSIGFFFGADILLDRQGQSAVTIEMSAIDRYAFRVGFNVGF
ncbi:MAG: hypothetical protein ACOYXU_03210 [Nitrospirota bacterium]